MGEGGWRGFVWGGHSAVRSLVWDRLLGFSLCSLSLLSKGYCPDPKGGLAGWSPPSTVAIPGWLSFRPAPLPQQGYGAVGRSPRHTAPVLRVLLVSLAKILLDLVQQVPRLHQHRHGGHLAPHLFPQEDWMVARTQPSV